REMKTKKLLKKLLLLVSLSLIILMTVFLVRNRNKLPKSFNVEIVKTGINVSIEDFHLIEEKEGKKQWELNADKAEVLDSKGITRLRNIEMNFFQKNGDELFVSADKGIIQNSSNNIELIGNIKVSNLDGYRLTTEKLNWTSDKKTIQTDDEIEINGKDLDITGKRMTVDVENEIFEIFGGVRVLYYRMKNGV
ncbi:MAG TPA: LPS export ABC transporter periplasmic protein LptC, partial [Nitrospinota bacterium]|nr:LPS export ABC transporter periplasmic protein LptC [Nitrospinota bacterium]